MLLSVFADPRQPVGEDAEAAHARAAEDAGFSAWFRTDGRAGRRAAPPVDLWSRLARAAEATRTIRVGAHVASVTDVHPGILAIEVAQLDWMTGGRAELGLGGWFEDGHRTLGLPAPGNSRGLAEALTVLTGLWATPDGRTFSHAGTLWRLTESPAVPKPVQSPVPVVLGGPAAVAAPAVVARFATELNAGVADGAELAEAAEAVAAAGASPRLAVSRIAAVGRTEAQFRARAEAAGADPARLRRSHLGGTQQEAADAVARLAEQGVQRLHLRFADLADLAHLDAVADALGPLAARPSPAARRVS